jgi:hypothetical protein
MERREVSINTRLRSVEQLARDLRLELTRHLTHDSKVPHAMAGQIKAEIDVVIRILNTPRASFPTSAD